MEPKKRRVRFFWNRIRQTVDSWRQRFEERRHGAVSVTQRHRRIRAVVCGCLCAVLLFGIALFALNAAVLSKVSERIVTSSELTAAEDSFDCILVLGCGVRSDGRMSDRLRNRVDVGISLYREGLSSVLLMSGDRSEDGNYDEVGAMKSAAVDAGIPEDRVWIDPCGFSTYESMVRLAELYGGQKVLIVSQEYHLYRALYIAEKLGLEAYGVCADLRSYRDQLKCEVRELFARVKDIWYVRSEVAVDLSKGEV